jgi:hypothetical protein
MPGSWKPLYDPFFSLTQLGARGLQFPGAENVMALLTVSCGEARTHAVIIQGSNKTRREHSRAAVYAAADPSVAGLSCLECLCARGQSRAAPS